MTFNSTIWASGMCKGHQVTRPALGAGVLEARPRPMALLASAPIGRGEGGHGQWKRGPPPSPPRLGRSHRPQTQKPSSTAMGPWPPAPPRRRRARAPARRPRRRPQRRSQGDLDYNNNSGHATPSLWGAFDWVVTVLYRSANHRVVSRCVESA